ncbi:hypothetical protein [Rhodococcus sp. 2G]|uniref:hypothetical protein n=1 Tax=Rhodococcus sp. 2G TaxID=1570939 RepID=UPI0012EB58A0|nr:hypothetical protein [Rhodococcus sp. 2G]
MADVDLDEDSGSEVDLDVAELGGNGTRDALRAETMGAVAADNNYVDLTGVADDHEACLFL